MKKVGLALASAFLVFAGFVAQAQEMPFGFGIKGGYLNPSLTGLDKATPWNGGGSTKVDLFNPSFNVGLFGEYAFHDYVGAGLEAYYAMTGAKFHKDGGTDNKMSVRIQQASIIPMLKIYPMGRDIDEVIFNIHLGPEVIIPIMASSQLNDTKAEDIKKDLNAFNFAGFGGFGVEFPFGLLIEARGSYAFMETFNKPEKGQENKSKKTTLRLADDSKQNSWYANVVLGYNFARLLEE